MFLAIFFFLEAGRRSRREVFFVALRGVSLSPMAFRDKSISVIIFLRLIFASALLVLLEFLGRTGLVGDVLAGFDAEVARLFCDFF